MIKFLLGFVTLAAVYAIWAALSTENASKPPQLDSNEWWGPTALKGAQDTSIRPFQIKFSDEVRIYSFIYTPTV